MAAPTQTPTVPAVGMVLGAIISIQTGAAVATGLFGEVGALGVVFLRALFSALLLVIIWRPALRMPREGRAETLFFGLALAGVNIFFYSAIDLIPLGTAVTFEFIGPLTVALITSRRRRDWFWAAMAATGIILLGGGIGGQNLDPLGIFFALAAGACWGAYILLGKRVAQRSAGGQGLAIAMLITTLISAPFGIASGGTDLIQPGVLAIGLLIGVLSSALPFSLELEAMRRLPSSVFGVMMSLEPAVATIIGLIILSQAVGGIQAVAVLLVISASAGALYSSRTPLPPEL